jgi:hypothetical protein
VLKLSRYYGIGIIQFYILQQLYEYKIEKNMGGKHENGILLPLSEAHRVVKCLIMTRKAFANKAYQIVFPTKTSYIHYIPQCGLCLK